MFNDRLGYVASDGSLVDCAEKSDGGHAGGRGYLAETNKSGGDAFYKGRLR